MKGILIENVTHHMSPYIEEPRFDQEYRLHPSDEKIKTSLSGHRINFKDFVLISIDRIPPNQSDSFVDL